MGGAGLDLRPDDRYVLPDGLRATLAGEFGDVLQTDDVAARLAGREVAAVGDVVSRTLQALGITPRFFVCDYKTRRGDEDEGLARVLGAWGDHEVRVENPAATITGEAWDAVFAAAVADGTTRIVVDGEEDLLGIPAFLAMPVGSCVVYGSPGRGLVVVDITPAFQEQVRGILARFEHR